MELAILMGWAAVGLSAAAIEPVLESAPAPAGPWAPDAGATIETTAPDRWRAVTALTEEATEAFYRLVIEQGYSAIDVTAIQVTDWNLQMEASGTPLPGPPERTIELPGGVSLVLLRIPPGTFQMGSPGDERSRLLNEGPVHTVTIAYEFYLGKYKVTQAQWLALMGTWPEFPPFPGVGDMFPAYYLCWNDAQDFITALNSHIAASGQGPLTVRLPSEAEWEYACRAGAQTRFSFGDSLGVEDGCEDDGLRTQHMWYCGNRYLDDGPEVVGTKSPNAFGLYDMHGNLYELCQDWYHASYAGAPADGSPWLVPAGSTRCVRGGCWGSEAVYCRSARRWDIPPTNLYRNSATGFRVAATP